MRKEGKPILKGEASSVAGVWHECQKRIVTILRSFGRLKCGKPAHDLQQHAQPKHTLSSTAWVKHDKTRSPLQ